jgi:hypothetical protein
MNEALARIHLQKADADIAAAHQRIDRQQKLIDQMVRDGHDSSAAQVMLQTLSETLTAMEQHRRIILAELGL